MDKILWADDEIDLLKPHILFLKAKGYDVTTVSNGRDAIDALDREPFSLVLLDENMPGISGLETLDLINQGHPEVPVIMITKSEEENIMDQAIGNRIADYLIKPVNPNQILLSIKKNLHSREIVTEQTSSDYRQEFQHISGDINRAATRDGGISPAGAVGTETGRNRQLVDGGNAADAEARRQFQFLQVRQA